MATVSEGDEAKTAPRVVSKDSNISAACSSEAGPMDADAVGACQFAARDYTRKVYTLLFCRRVGKDGTQQVLLGMKKRGFGEGKFNGFGGKVEPGETITQAAIRELQEESGVLATTVKQVAIIEFEFTNKPKVLEVHVFTCDSFTGEPVESEEMRPEWFASAAVPYKSMWADDELWLPAVLEGGQMLGYFKFLPDQATIVEQVMRPASEAELAAAVKAQARLPKHRPPSLGLSQFEAAAPSSE